MSDTKIFCCKEKKTNRNVVNVEYKKKTNLINIILESQLVSIERVLFKIYVS